jgi:hypothetical protein
MLYYNDLKRWIFPIKIFALKMFQVMIGDPFLKTRKITVWPLDAPS